MYIHAVETNTQLMGTIYPYAPVGTCSYCAPSSVFVDAPTHHDKNYYGTLLMLYRSTVTALIGTQPIQLACFAGSTSVYLCSPCMKVLAYNRTQFSSGSRLHLQ